MSKVSNDPNPSKAVRFPFGRYSGQFLSEIPVDYLEWASDKMVTDSQLLDNIDRELKRRAGGHAGLVIRRGK